MSSIRSRCFLPEPAFSGSCAPEKPSHSRLSETLIFVAPIHCAPSVHPSSVAHGNRAAGTGVSVGDVFEKKQD